MRNRRSLPAGPRNMTGSHVKKQKWKIWKYKGLRVHYLPQLDGSGRQLAEPCVNFYKTIVFAGKPFPKAFEWCCGPSFIGFALLAEGICDRLCVADINPLALEAVRRSVEDNGLQDRVTYYLSDNFKSIPSSESFDLVVGNPPWYCTNNSAHTLCGSHYFPRMVDGVSICAIDTDWKIHRSFYRGVSEFLNPGAIVSHYVQEPFETELFLTPRWFNRTFIEPKPFNVRPRPPIHDFREMIDDGGLTYIAAIKERVFVKRWRSPKKGLWFLLSKKLSVSERES